MYGAGFPSHKMTFLFGCLRLGNLLSTEERPSPITFMSVEEDAV